MINRRKKMGVAGFITITFIILFGALFIHITNKINKLIVAKWSGQHYKKMNIFSILSNKILNFYRKN
jgi:hypothetical protein